MTGEILSPVASSLRLRGRIGSLQYLALGFGTMIGSAWVILLGDWLGKAGPGGAIVGFAAGALVMMAVGACYAELTSRIPEAGSEFVYAHRVFGPGPAFAVGWFLVLYLICVTVFEGLAVGWIVEIVTPSWRPLVLYRAFGAPIFAQTLIVALTATVAIWALNHRGTRLAVVTHSTLTYAFAAIVIALLLAMLWKGRVGAVGPWFATTNGRPWWLGSGAIFAFCAYALNGFQAIPQAIEERAPGMELRTVGWLILIVIACAAAFYVLVVLAGSAMRPWRELAGMPLPIVAAARSLPYGPQAAYMLLAATAASLLKAWNGIFMMAARLLVAMARAGHVPQQLARVHPRLGSPAAALGFVGLCNSAGLLLGKGAIEPITDMCAMVLTLTYLLCCLAVVRARRGGQAAPFRVPGGRAVVWIGGTGGALMAVAAFATPFIEQSGIPLEWRLLGAWSLAGAAVWLIRRRHEVSA